MKERQREREKERKSERERERVREIGTSAKTSVCTNTNIQGCVIAMSSPDKSTSEDLKRIFETYNC